MGDTAVCSRRGPVRAATKPALRAGPTNGDVAFETARWSARRRLDAQRLSCVRASTSKDPNMKAAKQCGASPECPPAQPQNPFDQARTSPPPAVTPGRERSHGAPSRPPPHRISHISATQVCQSTTRPTNRSTRTYPPSVDIPPPPSSRCVYLRATETAAKATAAPAGGGTSDAVDGDDEPCFPPPGSGWASVGRTAGGGGAPM